MDNSDSDHQPSHSTENNTFSNQPTDDKHNNDYISWKHLSNHVAYMPVTQGGTVFYVPPSAVTVPTPIPTNVQMSSSIPSATAVPFIPLGSSTVLQPSPTHFSLQAVVKLLASTKKIYHCGNCPNTRKTRFIGTSESDNSRAQLTRLH